MEQCGSHLGKAVFPCHTTSSLTKILPIQLQFVHSMDHFQAQKFAKPSAINSVSILTSLPLST
jgi:hypothetical protein